MAPVAGEEEGRGGGGREEEEEEEGGYPVHRGSLYLAKVRVLDNWWIDCANTHGGRGKKKMEPEIPTTLTTWTTHTLKTPQVGWKRNKGHCCRKGRGGSNNG